MKQLKGDIKQDINQTEILFRIKNIKEILGNTSDYIDSQFESLTQADSEELEIEDEMVSGIIKSVEYSLETLRRYL